MLLEFCYGPKVGFREHVSREVGAALIAGGFAVEVAAQIDPVDAARKAHPIKGWSIWRQADAQTGEIRCFIAHHDGCGGRTLYSGPPSPQRVHRYDPATEREFYEWVPSDCQQSVIEEFKRLGGGPKDPLAEGDEAALYNERKARMQGAIHEQNKKGVYFGK